MTPFERKVADDLRAYNLRWNGSVKGTRADYITVYRDFCRNDGNYTKTFETRLYQKHSVEYCCLLELLAYHYRDHQQKEAVQ